MTPSNGARITVKERSRSAFVDRRAQLAGDALGLVLLRAQAPRHWPARRRARPRRSAHRPRAPVAIGRRPRRASALLAIVGLGELLLALEIARGALGVGLRRVELRLGLGDAGARAASICRPMRAIGALLRRELVLGRLQRQAIIAVVDPGDQVAGLDGLVVRDRDRGHVARHLRGQDRDVGLDIGVVGRDHEAPVGPPVVAEMAAVAGSGRAARRPAAGCGSAGAGES